MLQVFPPVGRILRRELSVLQNQKVLRVRFLGCLGEVEAARDYPDAVDDHDLVVSNRMFGVDERLDPSSGNEIGGRILFRALAFVQDHLNLDSSIVSIDQGLRYRSRREAVGLNQDGLPGLGQFSNDRICASAFWAEMNLPLGDAIGGEARDQR